MEVNTNGLNIYVNKDNTARYIALPQNAWRSAGRCDCKYCKGAEGFWDTLVVPNTGSTFNVHCPELQSNTPSFLKRQF